MRRQRISMLLLLLLAAALASCSPGHLGGTEIAFLRDGHLWTIDPDGANAFEVAADGPPVIGYGWSPDHHILVFRTLDSSLASKHVARSEEHTSELQSHLNLVCRLLLEKKKKRKNEETSISITTCNRCRKTYDDRTA